MVAQPGIPGIPGSNQPSMGHAGTTGPPGVTSLIGTPQPYTYHPVSGQNVGSIAPSTSSQPMAQYTVAANSLPAGAYHVNTHVPGQQTTGQYVTTSQQQHSGTAGGPPPTATVNVPPPQQTAFPQGGYSSGHQTTTAVVAQGPGSQPPGTNAVYPGPPAAAFTHDMLPNSMVPLQMQIPPGQQPSSIITLQQPNAATAYIQQDQPPIPTAAITPGQLPPGAPTHTHTPGNLSASNA